MLFGAMNFPVRPVMQEIDALASLELDFLELAMDAPFGHFSVLMKEKNEISARLSELGMALVCHLPTFVYTADLTASIRQASLDEISFSIEAAAELKALKVVFHPSIISGLAPYVLPTALSYAHEAIDLVVARASEMGIMPCIENLFPKNRLFFRPDDFIPLFDRHPDLFFTLDTGHANLAAGKDVTIQDFIYKLKNRIRHLHISDNNGRRDEHLCMGSGNIRFGPVVSALMQIGFDETVTFEVFEEDRNKILLSKNLFLHLQGTL